MNFKVLFLSVLTASVMFGGGSAMATPANTSIGHSNGSTAIDSKDLSKLVQKYGSTTYKNSDLNSDGVVNYLDASILLSLFNG